MMLIIDFSSYCLIYALFYIIWIIRVSRSIDKRANTILEVCAIYAVILNHLICTSLDPTGL